MTADQRCSFCGHHQNDVDQLVAGPRAFICDRCIKTCSENFHGEIPATAPLLVNRPRYSTNNVHGPDACCLFCGKRWDDVQWVVGGQRDALICAECVWLALQIVNEGAPSAPTGHGHGRERHRSWRTWFRMPLRSQGIDSTAR